MQGMQQGQDNLGEHAGLYGLLASAFAFLWALLPRIDAWFKDRQTRRDDAAAKRNEGAAYNSAVEEQIRKNFITALESSRAEVNAYQKETQQLRVENDELREMKHKLLTEIEELEAEVHDLKLPKPPPL